MKKILTLTMLLLTTIIFIQPSFANSDIIIVETQEISYELGGITDTETLTFTYENKASINEIHLTIDYSDNGMTQDVLSYIQSVQYYVTDSSNVEKIDSYEGSYSNVKGESQTAIFTYAELSYEQGDKFYIDKIALKDIDNNNVFITPSPHIYFDEGSPFKPEALTSDFDVTSTSGWDYEIAQNTMLVSDETSTTLWFMIAPNTMYLDQIDLDVYMRYGSLENDVSLLETIDLDTAFRNGYISHEQGSKFSVTVPTVNNGYPVEFQLTVYDSNNSSYDSAYANDILNSLYMGFPEPTLPSSSDTESPIVSGNSVVYSDIETPIDVNYAKNNLTATDETDGDISNSITVKTDGYTGNEGVLGDYDVIYTVSDSSGNTADFTVTYRVVDVTVPVINLNGSSTITIENGNAYTETATVTDNYDTGITLDITGSVDTNVDGTYTITYNATDSSGNVAETVTRTVIVETSDIPDTTNPVINLNGSSTITLTVGDTFTETATVTDDTDTGVTLDITGSVDTNTVGTYTITYNATDSSGNSATTVTRTVVVEAEAPTDTTAPVFTVNEFIFFTKEEADSMTQEEIISHLNNR